VTLLPAGYFCPTGSSTVSTGATRRLLTQRPSAALAAGRYGRDSPTYSLPITESTDALLEKRRGDRQQPQPCNASPRLEPSSRSNSPTTVNADLAVVADSTVEVILATGRQGRSRLTRLMGWEPVQQADLRTNLAEVRSYGACPRLA
jgi:hypothetical protein